MSGKPIRGASPALAMLLLALANPGPAAAQSGDVARGAAAIRAYGCGSCHVIPGIPGANGHVGPPLDRIARRAYLGGVLTNTPENMARWLRAPGAVDPRTAMPDLGIDPATARDITAYLYTLK